MTHKQKEKFLSRAEVRAMLGIDEWHEFVTRLPQQQFYSEFEVSEFLSMRAEEESPESDDDCRWPD